MPQVTPKTARVFKSVDDELAHHLEQAEDHLIKAVMLFAKSRKPQRTAEFVSKLGRAQELVTSVYRAELVHRRGLKRPRR